MDAVSRKPCEPLAQNPNWTNLKGRNEDARVLTVYNKDKFCNYILL
jgi:hypothetical protein